MTKKAQVVAPPGQQSIHITRDFDASREVVYQAITDPALIRQWWGRDNTTITIEELDVRKGGIWRFVERDDEGHAYTFTGVYHLVVPQEQIIQTFEFEPMPGHHVLLENMTLEAQGGRTRLRVTQVFQSVEDRDGMLQAGMEGGMNESYQRLDALLEKLTSA